MAQFSFPSNRMHNGMSYFLKEYSFFYQLLFHDTFVNLTKMWKQRFMKKRMLWKKVNPLCTASDFRGKGGCWEVETVQDFLIKLDIISHTYAYIGNKHFFKSCHRQTYQNYEQPPQRLQNSYFQSHFSASKINRIFLKFFFYEEY